MSRTKQGALYIMITTLLFSSMEIALKMLGNSFHPVQLNFIRFLVGGLVLLPFALRILKKKRDAGSMTSSKTAASLAPRDFGKFALLGLAGVVLSMTLYQLAVVNTEASVVAVLFSSNPLFVLFFAALLLHEAVHKNHVAALVLEVAGILFIINPFHIQWSIAGIVFTILSTLIFALYGVMGKRQCRRFGGLVVTCFSFLFGGAELLALAALSHLPFVAELLQHGGLGLFANIPFFSGWSLSELPVMLYVCIGVTGIGFACYFMAMEKVSANTASLVFFFKPALAPVLAFLLLGEQIPLHMLLGILLVLAGSLCSLLPPLLVSVRHRRSLANQAASV